MNAFKFAFIKYIYFFIYIALCYWQRLSEKNCNWNCIYNECFLSFVAITFGSVLSTQQQQQLSTNQQTNTNNHTNVFQVLVCMFMHSKGSTKDIYILRFLVPFLQTFVPIVKNVQLLQAELSLHVTQGKLLYFKSYFVNLRNSSLLIIVFGGKNWHGEYYLGSRRGGSIQILEVSQ